MKTSIRANASFHFRNLRFGKKVYEYSSYIHMNLKIRFSELATWYQNDKLRLYEF